jgi:hypothetical protein
VFAPPPGGITPDLSGLVPYVGANQTINFGVQRFLTSGHATFLGGAGTDYSTAPIEVQYANHPRVSFHWPGVVASQLGMDATGAIRTYDNPGTGFADFKAGRIDSSGVIVSGSDLHSNAAVISAGGIYPGRQDAPAGKQTSWYLASHGSYGLLTNTGLYLGGGLYPQGGMDPNYLTRENPPAEFTMDGLGSFFPVGNYNNWWYRHNGVLHVSWMVDVNWPGSLNYGHFYIPGGFTAQKYGNFPCMVFTDGFVVQAYAQVSPGSTVIMLYSSNGNNFAGSGRLAGQMMIYVG